MAVKLPDPKTIADAAIDGVVDLIEGPVRVAESFADVLKDYATGAKSDLDELKKRLPDDPSVFIDVGLRGLGNTLKGGIGTIESLTKGVADTFEAVKADVKRIVP